MTSRHFLPLAAFLLIAGPALAQQSMQQGDFLTQEGPDLWRASKLPGLGVFGPGNQRVGAISDVLVTRDGHATYIVVGVGGFLGIGAKDVAVPYDQVHFSTTPVVPPVTAADQATPATPMGENPQPAPGTLAPVTASRVGAAGTMAAGTGLGAPNASTAEPTAMAAREHSTAYPDHATINMTRDQLKAAPAFNFAK